MSTKTITGLALLALAALSQPPAHAQPGRTVSPRGDADYSRMSRAGKVTYLTAVIDQARQSALASQEVEREIKRVEQQQTKVRAARAAAADAGISTAAADQKLTELAAKSAELGVKADKLREQARTMAAEARKRKAQDEGIHREALEAALRMERGELPPGPTVTILGRRDRTDTKK